MPAKDRTNRHDPEEEDSNHDGQAARRYTIREARETALIGVAPARRSGHQLTLP